MIRGDILDIRFAMKFGKIMARNISLSGYQCYRQRWEQTILVG